MPDEPDLRRSAATAIGAGRVAYGAAMAVAPRRMLRLQVGGDPTGPMVWLARAFGIRDAVLGAGVLLAPDDAARRGWVAAGAAADAGDLLGALAGARHLGRARALVVAVVAAIATGAGGWSLGGQRDASRR